MEKYGFSIIIALVTDIRPAANVMAAMNEINASSRQREAAIQKAEANKLTAIKHAEADAESKFLQGQGIARQRLAIVRPLSPLSSLLCHSQPTLTAPSAVCPSAVESSCSETAAMQ